MTLSINLKSGQKGMLESILNECRCDHVAQNKYIQNIIAIQFKYSFYVRHGRTYIIKFLKF